MRFSNGVKEEDGTRVTVVSPTATDVSEVEESLCLRVCRDVCAIVRPKRWQTGQPESSL